MSYGNKNIFYKRTKYTEIKIQNLIFFAKNLIWFFWPKSRFYGSKTTNIVYKNHRFSPKWPYNKAKKCRWATKTCFLSKRNTQKPKSKIWIFLRQIVYTFLTKKSILGAKKQQKSSKKKQHIFQILIFV